MADKDPESPNPPQIIGAPVRQSSKMELYEFHKNNGTLGMFYDLYPDLRPCQVERDPSAGGRER
jgi:hypothetical protein